MRRRAPARYTFTVAWRRVPISGARVQVSHGGRVVARRFLPGLSRADTLARAERWAVAARREDMRAHGTLSRAQVEALCLEVT